VALKEIQTEHASYILHRQRFLQEAEITGGLEHPGIGTLKGTMLANDLTCSTMVVF
jgi:hypothetical protein